MLGSIQAPPQGAPASGLRCLPVPPWSGQPPASTLWVEAPDSAEGSLAQVSVSAGRLADGSDNHVLGTWCPRAESSPWWALSPDCLSSQAGECPAGVPPAGQGTGEVWGQGRQWLPPGPPTAVIAPSGRQRETTLHMQLHPSRWPQGGHGAGPEGTLAWHVADGAEMGLWLRALRAGPAQRPLWASGLPRRRQAGQGLTWRPHCPGSNS